MPTTAIFRNFQSAQFWRNRYLRRDGMFQIWDANLHHGDVRPFACPVQECNEQDIFASLFPLDSCPCLGFEDGRKVVQGFSDNQFFHIEDGYLVQSTETQLCNGLFCRAGSPQPTSAPTVGSSSCGSCGATAMSYVITYITEHDGIWVESSPSDPSTPLACGADNSHFNLSWDAAPDDFCIVAINLYRSEVSSTDTNGIADAAEYVLVNTFDASARTYTDNIYTAGTTQPLLTYDPLRFPAPGNLVSVGRSSDGLVVADSHRVYISLPGEPQFTFDGVVEIEDEILWIEVVDNNVVVLTDNKPVIVSFSNGVSLNVERTIIHRNLPLKSVKSVSSYNSNVYWVSTYGLYVWAGGRYGTNIASSLQSLITPEQWKNIDSTTVAGTAYEYGYIFSSDDIDYSVMVEFGEDGTDTVNSTSAMPISYINPVCFGLNKDGIILYQDYDGIIWSWDWRRDVCQDFYLHDHVRPNRCEQCECCPWFLELYYDNEGKNRFSHMRVEFDERSWYDGIQLSFHVHEFGREIETLDEMQIISSRGFGIPRYNISYQSLYARLTSCAIMHEVRFATSAQELCYNSNNLSGDTTEQ